MGTLQERVSYVFIAIRESLARLERRMDALDDKMSRQFLWLVGIQITTLVAVVGAVLSRG